jgi:hypothetical protein
VHTRQHFLNSEALGDTRPGQRADRTETLHVRVIAISSHVPSKNRRDDVSDAEWEAGPSPDVPSAHRASCVSIPPRFCLALVVPARLSRLERCPLTRRLSINPAERVRPTTWGLITLIGARRASCRSWTQFAGLPDGAHPATIFLAPLGGRLISPVPVGGGRARRGLTNAVRTSAVTVDLTAPTPAFGSSGLVTARAHNGDQKQASKQASRPSSRSRYLSSHVP